MRAISAANMRSSASTLLLSEIRATAPTLPPLNFFKEGYHMTDKETILTVEAEDELCDGKGVEDDE